MCNAPNKLPDGTLVGCRECWQCSGRYVDDWVGRCIAESKTARASHSVTLTYGRDEDGNSDHIRARLLTYSDVQKWLKRLRTAGYPLRYFCVGEYGSERGRAHWHLIVYWKDRVPALKLEANVVQALWDEGHSHWKALTRYDEVSNSKAVKYVCKYTQKDLQDMEAQGRLRMSKKPPLGAEWFERLAARYVEQGLSPQSLFYRHPGIEQDGKPKEFMLRPGSASADRFCRVFLEKWEATHGGHPPSSQLLDEYADRMFIKEHKGTAAELNNDQRMQDARAWSEAVVRFLDPTDPEFFHNRRQGVYGEEAV